MIPGRWGLATSASAERVGTLCWQAPAAPSARAGAGLLRDAGLPCVISCAVSDPQPGPPNSSREAESAHSAESPLPRSSLENSGMVHHAGTPASRKTVLWPPLHAVSPWIGLCSRWRKLCPAGTTSAAAKGLIPPLCALFCTRYVAARLSPHRCPCGTPLRLRVKLICRPRSARRAGGGGGGARPARGRAAARVHPLCRPRSARRSRPPPPPPPCWQRLPRLPLRLPTVHAQMAAPAACLQVCTLPRQSSLRQHSQQPPEPRLRAAHPPQARQQQARQPWLRHGHAT